MVVHRRNRSFWTGVLFLILLLMCCGFSNTEACVGFYVAVDVLLSNAGMSVSYSEDRTMANNDDVNRAIRFRIAVRCLGSY